MGLLFFSKNAPKDVIINSIKCVIFPESYDIFFITHDKRCAISEDEANNAETILEKFVKDKDPIIFSRMKEYIMQIFGLINKNGEKVVYINAGIGFEKFERDYKKEYIYTDEDHHLFFNVKVNLKDKNCYDFNVNEDV